jgi:hypothetical protein
LDEVAVNWTRRRSNRYTRAKTTNGTSHETEARSYEGAGRGDDQEFVRHFRVSRVPVEYAMHEHRDLALYRVNPKVVAQLNVDVFGELRLRRSSVQLT